MSVPGSYIRITDISVDAIHDDAFHGPRRFYAWDGQEESTCWTGPHVSIAEALEAYLDEHDPADDEGIDVTLARPLRMPCVGGIADDLLNATCDEDWPEGAVEALANAVGDDEDELDLAVTAFVHEWLDARGLSSAIDGYWQAYGRTLETTAGDARRWLQREVTL